MRRFRKAVRQKRSQQKKEKSKEAGIKHSGRGSMERNGVKQCDHCTLQPSHNFLTADRTFIPLRCCWATPHNVGGTLRAMIREVKDGVSEVENNCLFEIRDKVAEERRRRERRARGALRMDIGIVEQSVLAVGKADRKTKWVAVVDETDCLGSRALITWTFLRQFFNHTFGLASSSPHRTALP